MKHQAKVNTSQDIITDNDLYTYNAHKMKNHDKKKYKSGKYTDIHSCSRFYSGSGNNNFMAGAFFIVLIFSACEKIIDVDLSDSDPVIVIEGNLSYDKGELEVRLSKSGSYFANTPYETVSGAKVFLDGGPGYSLMAEETGNGIYRLTELPLNAGTVYGLKVNAEGQEYTAVSKLNPEVKIDSLGYEYVSEGRFFEEGYRLLLFFIDPSDSENYYRVKVYRNGKYFNSREDIIIFDDSDLNGKGIQVRLRGQLFAQGDTARVELYSVDKNTWEYFNSLRDLINLNPGSPAPANPVSIFSNGAMGYFSAWSSSEKEVVIGD